MVCSLHCVRVCVCVFRSVSGPGSKSKPEGRQRGNAFPGPKLSHTTPDSETEAILSAASEFANPSQSKEHQGLAPSRDTPAQAILCSDIRLAAAPPTSADNDRMISMVQRKITSTIDELVINADFQVGHDFYCSQGSMCVSTAS